MKLTYASVRTLPVFLILAAALSITLPFVSTACKHSTPLQRIILTGSIHLDGEDSHSGVKVLLYAMDTSVVGNTELISAAGILNVGLDQQRVFDHRDSDPIAIAETDLSGNFEIEVAKGEYNIVILKPGFGLRYFCGQLLNEDISFNSLIDPGDEVLYPDVTYAGVYTSGTYTLLRNHHYVISDNVSFVDGSQLIIEPGAIISLAEDRYLNVNCGFKLRGDPDRVIRFTVDDSLYATQKRRSQVFFDKIQIQPDAVTLEGTIDNVVFSDMLNGIKVNQDSSVKNCTFMGGYENLGFSEAESVMIEGNLFISKISSEAYSVNISNSNNVVFKNNILWNTKQGLQLSVTNALAIDYNYFYNSLNCVYLHHWGNAVFTHNTMKTSGTAVKSYITCNTEYYYNDITADYGLDFGGTYDYGKANNNNLNCTSFAIKYLSYRSGDMEARQNYYFTTDPVRLGQIIWDKRDVSNSYQWYDIMNYVLFEPYKAVPVNGAGI